MTLYSRIFKIVPWIQLYETSFAIFAALFLSIIFIIVDRKPQQFPIPMQRPVLDCGNLQMSKIIGDTSRIKFELKLNNFLQYPPNIAQHLIRIQVTNDDYEVQYTSKEFWDLTRVNDNVSFCILHALNGNVEVNAFCQNEKIASEKIYIPNVPVYPIGWSRVESTYDRTANFADVCIANRSIIYSIQSQNATLPPIRVANNYQIPIITNSSGRVEIQKKTNSTYLENTTVILSATSSENFMQIIDTVLPLWAFMSSYRPSISHYAFADGEDFLDTAIKPLLSTASKVDLSLPRIPHLEFDDEDKSSYDFLFPLNETKTEDPNPNKNETKNYCLQSAEFVMTTGGEPYTFGHTSDVSRENALSREISWIQTYNPEIIPPLRNCYLKNHGVGHKMIPGRIVLAPYAGKIVGAKFLKNAFAKIDSSEIPEVITLTAKMDVPTVVRLVSSANVLIVSDVAEAVLGVFLDRSAALVEIQPKGSWCNYFANDYLRLSGARYFPFYQDPSSRTLGKSEHCFIFDTKEYFAAQKYYAIIDEDQLRSVVCRALDRNCSAPVDIADQL